MKPTFDELDYCPRLRDMIELGRAELPSGNFIPVQGASTLNNLRVIRHLIFAEKPESTLEIGLAFGASALAILKSLTEVHSSNFHHTAIDPYQESVWKSAAIHNIELEGMSGNFTHIAQDSALALPELCSQEREYNLIYVDGSHLFEDVFVDFLYCCRLLSHNGLILFDDCTNQHVRKVIRFIDRNYKSILKHENLSSIGESFVLKRIANQLGIRQLTAYRKISKPPRNWDADYRAF